MAEGFANHYGSDVLRASSAGLAPTVGVAGDTVRAMQEMNIDVSHHLPRRYDPFEAVEYDVVVNLAGYKLPGPPPRQLIDWEVKDPYGTTLDKYRIARNDLEGRVMRLILDLRRQAKNR
jgi:arsenate reductase